MCVVTQRTEILLDTMSSWKGPSCFLAGFPCENWIWTAHHHPRIHHQIFPDLFSWIFWKSEHPNFVGKCMFEGIQCCFVWRGDTTHLTLDIHSHLRFVSIWTPQHLLFEGWFGGSFHTDPHQVVGGFGMCLFEPWHKKIPSLPGKTNARTPTTGLLKTGQKWK